MNTDPKKSAQPCGCDPGAGHICSWHQWDAYIEHGGPRPIALDKFIQTPSLPSNEGMHISIVPTRPSLPIEDADRKALPLWTGVMMYFPDALLAVAAVSKAGNDQHNPGQPLHWERGKSMDQMNTAARHMLDHSQGNLKDIKDNTYHLAKAAWRILAELQLTIEKERA